MNEVIQKLKKFGFSQAMFFNPRRNQKQVMHGIYTKGKFTACLHSEPEGLIISVHNAENQKYKIFDRSEFETLNAITV